MVTQFYEKDINSIWVICSLNFNNVENFAPNRMFNLL